MAAEWIALGFVFVVVAFLLVTLALSGARTELCGSGGAVEGLVIAAFVALLACFTLATLGQYGQLKENDQEKIVIIVNIAATFVSAILIVIAMSFYGCRVNRKPPAYTATLLVSGAVMAALAGVFYTVEIINRS